MKWPTVSNERLLRFACALGLLALPLMVWSVFDPRVWPVLLALSLGQVIGSASLLLFLIVVVRDLEIVKRLLGRTAQRSDPAN